MPAKSKTNVQCDYCLMLWAKYKKASTFFLAPMDYQRIRPQLLVLSCFRWVLMHTLFKIPTLADKKITQSVLTSRTIFTILDFPL